jgi:hypothetical protein
MNMWEVAWPLAGLLLTVAALAGVVYLAHRSRP